MNLQTASTEQQSEVIFHRAIRGQFLTKDETLAIYANNKNWRKETHPDRTKGCMWVWQGPVICAPGAAQMTLDRDGAEY